MRLPQLDKYRVGGTEEKPVLNVPLPRTPTGRVYRNSPNEAALPRHFVIGNPIPEFVIDDAARPRMKLTPRSNRTVCPYSGVVAEDSEFTHPDDVQAAVEKVSHAFLSDMDAELSRMFEGFGSSLSRNSGITVKVSKSPSYRPPPRFLREDLLRDLVCDHCGRDYGVYAIALYCPDCGAPNLRLHFAREVDLVRHQVDLADAHGNDAKELAYRLLGNAHEDVLTAFEATLKTVYLQLCAQQGSDAPEIKRVTNDFQNVARARARFSQFEFDPFDELDAGCLGTLELNIQKRHIIGHNLGIVDEKFAEHAVEARVGETVRLIGDDVRAFAAISQLVVDRLDARLGGSPSPFIGERSPIGLVGSASRTDQAAGSAAEPLAQQIGAWICKNSEIGLEDPVPEEDLREEFQKYDISQLEEAIAELEVDGYLETTPYLNEGLPRIRPNLSLFATFDPAAIGTDPTHDACELIGLALATGTESVAAAELHGRTGWTLRRFNPALGILLGQIDSDHVSKAGDGQYASYAFMLFPEDRVRLKRFAISRAKPAQP